MYICTYIYVSVTAESLLVFSTRANQKASVAFGRLKRRVWNDRGLTINTKVDVYMECCHSAPSCCRSFDNSLESHQGSGTIPS